METHDAIEHLRGDDVRLAFDTNALYGLRRLGLVCQRLHRLSARQGNKILLFASVAAHAEKLFDIKQAKQDAYDYQAILDGLATLQLRIQSFEECHAQSMGDLLGRHYKTSQEWHEAKRKHYLTTLGLSPNMPTSGTGSQCSATLDWLIAAHAQAEDWILITNDKGPEFRGLTLKMKIQTLEAALDLLDGSTRD